jgi:protein-S-isoprenylcysteine O-methyltransferase Ste14
MSKTVNIIIFRIGNLLVILMIITLPLNIELQIVLTLWILIEIVSMAIIRIHRRGTVVQKRDRGSSLLIFGVIIVSLVIVSYFGTNNIATLPSWVFYPGIVLMILGIILRLWSMLVLGRFFSGAVGTQEGQFVVDKGPYKFVCHPSYTGALLILIGLGLAVQSWGAVIILILLFSLAYGYRMHIEEKALISELGENYIEYRKRTKRLIPYLI